MAAPFSVSGNIANPIAIPSVLACACALVMSWTQGAQGQTVAVSHLEKILLLDKSQGGANGYRESRRDLKAALSDLASVHGFLVDTIGQNDSQAKLRESFAPASLAGYQAVLFAYNDGVDRQVDSISKINVQQYVENGGTLIAIHAASAFVQNWDWYTRSLVQSFYGPWGHNQPRADLAHDAQGLAAGSETQGIFKGLEAPNGFLDMFISFRESPRDTPGVTILVTVDEESFTKPVDGPMGADHPVVWVKEVGKGKVIHNSLGFSWSISNVYAQNGGYLKSLLYGLLRYGAGDFRGCTDSNYMEFNPDATRSEPAACKTLNISSIRPGRGQVAPTGRPLRIEIGSAEPFRIEMVDAHGRIERSHRGVGPLEWTVDFPARRGIHFLHVRVGNRLETFRLTAL